MHLSVTTGQCSHSAPNVTRINACIICLCHIIGLWTTQIKWYCNCHYPLLYPEYFLYVQQFYTECFYESPFSKYGWIGLEQLAYLSSWNGWHIMDSRQVNYCYLNNQNKTGLEPAVTLYLWKTAYRPAQTCSFNCDAHDSKIPNPYILSNLSEFIFNPLNNFNKIAAQALLFHMNKCLARLLVVLR